MGRDTFGITMMQRELCHIWGPFSVYSYGIAMALAIMVFTIACLRHPWRKKLISEDAFIEVVMLSLIVGLAGARALFLINSFDQLDSYADIFSLWNGGLSILGSIIAIVLVMPWYLRRIKVAILPLLDLAALNAPLIHVIARLGCFMAGCCYGRPTNLPWAITYTDPFSQAPQHIGLHPTQLYASILMLLVFAFFYFYLQKKVKAPGQMLMAYLMAEGAVRFSMDFLRDDIEYFPWDTHHILSSNQFLALGMFSSSLVISLIIHYTYIHNKQKNTAL